RLAAGQTLEKLEVLQGGWGDLCRAINGLVQEQREQERLRIAPTGLAADAQPGAGTQRTVAILLIGCASISPGYGQTRRPSILAWQALANATRQIAQHHGALLQPCGDAIMLVFGTRGERPVDDSLLAAVAAAERLRSAWQRADNSGALAFSITSGSVTVTTLPGLGCCVLGTPVEQALHIERLALASPFYHTLCDEAAYYALRRQQLQHWQPTEFRIQSPEGRPQVVYGAMAD
ncbi:MAG: hypothetical protein H7Z42_21355, partial [Roseiflexaceae bacterium]|nr:hypothetical protein [Roseiflexaceae bacterium]